MPIGLYMDQHVPRSITLGLRMRGVDVVTAFEDGAQSFSDQRLLDRALEMGRVLFTQDVDFLVESARRTRENLPFAGLIYGHQLRVTIGGCVRDLQILAILATPEEFRNQVVFLPL